MKQIFSFIRFGITFLGILFLAAGCGAYHLGTTLPSNLQTVYVPTFENKTYQPGIEVDITNAVITRYRQDGNLRPVSEDEADTVLRGEIIGWRRRVMGYTGVDDTEVEEYRLYVIAVITFVDRTTGESLITRQQVRGHTDFFVENDLPDEENAARPKAYKDLARRIVDQTVSIW